MNKPAAWVFLCLLICWVSIFLGKAVWPQTRMLYGGLLGRQSGWKKGMEEHQRLRQFVIESSAVAAAFEGQVLFAYGQNPEFDRTDDLLVTLAQIKYLLYPSRGHSASHSNSKISYIAVYHADEKTYSELPFCRRIGEQDYLCRVTEGAESHESLRVDVSYNAPHFNLVAEATESEPGNIALVLVTIKDFPLQRCFDLNVSLPRSGADGNRDEHGSSHRLHLYLPALGPAPLPEYRFSLISVDKEGRLYRTPDYRMVLSSTVP
jgi:hypothetical protein